MVTDKPAGSIGAISGKHSFEKTIDVGVRLLHTYKMFIWINKLI